MDAEPPQGLAPRPPARSGTLYVQGLGRDGEIRTLNSSLPKRVVYQIDLHPVFVCFDFFLNSVVRL